MRWKDRQEWNRIFFWTVMIVSVLFVTATQAAVIDDILNLAIPTPYQLSPIELQEKYKHLVRMEKQTGSRKRIGFHHFSKRVEETRSIWETVLKFTYTIHRNPQAWVILKWETVEMPGGGVMHTFIPQSCWEMEGKIPVQTWGKKEVL